LWIDSGGDDPRPVYSALYSSWRCLPALDCSSCCGRIHAAALVIIYAGAILVTYVFVIMLATQSSISSGPAEGSELEPWLNTIWSAASR